MRNSIFISYRRDGGEALAQLLYDRLTAKGYSVFYDIESLRSGPFDTKLYEKIEECDDFVLVLPQHALDRCIYDEDWVRCEIKHALKMGKNIIPILMRGFVFPQNLPEDIQAVSKRHGVEFETMEFLDARVEKLISMLSPSIVKAEETLDDQLNAKFNELFNGICPEKEDDKTELRKKLERQQYLKHIQSFIPPEYFLTGSEDIFFIRLNNNSFSIKAPANIKFSAAVIFREYYDFKTLTVDPQLSISKFVKTVEMEGNNCTTTFRMEDDKREIDSDIADIVLISIDTVQGFGYLFYQNKNSQSTPGRAFFSNPMRLEYDMQSKSFSSASYDESVNEEREKLYDANDASKVVIIDLKTGDIIVRHAEYDESGKKAYKISLTPFQQYLAVNFEIKNCEKRKMTAKEIADCYYDGISGFPCNILKAMEYYEQDGSAESLFKIGEFFLKNELYQDDYFCLNYMIQSSEKDYLEAIDFLINYYYKAKKYDEAIPFNQKKVEILKHKALKSQSEEDLDAWAYANLDQGILLIDAKKPIDSEPFLLNALNIYKGFDNENYSREIGDLYFWLSNTYFDQGEYVRPKECLLSAIEFYKRCSATDNLFFNRLRTCFNNLAFAYKNMEQYEEAEKAYLKAYDISKDLVIKDSGQYTTVLKAACKKLIAFYELIGKLELKNKYEEELATLE